jgi:serine O-acetyltransferase
MFANLRSDSQSLRLNRTRSFPWYVIEALLFDNGFQAVVLHRVAHSFKRRRIPVIGSAIARFNLFLTGVDIAPGAVIGPGLIIAHGTGIVIGDCVRIGRRACLLHQVTIGAPHYGRLADMPRLGDDIVVGAGAKLIGGIHIGDRAFIGVNAIVTEDVPDDGRVLVQSTAALSSTSDSD